MVGEIFKSRAFDKWARKARLEDASLCNAIFEMQSGLFEADLGGGLFKKRVARPGQGKSGGYRTLIATNKLDLWFVVYGFAKNERENIGMAEQAALKAAASDLTGLPAAKLAGMERADDLARMKCDEQV